MSENGSQISGNHVVNMEITSAQSAINPIQRFLYGGIGALMPVCVTLISLDLVTAFSKNDVFNLANFLGIGIRYSLLFLIGGFIAYLHNDEQKPFKLFEIGVAAPALITSLITVNAAQGQIQDIKNKTPSVFEFSLFPSAYASEKSDYKTQDILMAGGFLGGVIDGVTGKIYQYDKIPNSDNGIPANRRSMPASAQWAPGKAGDIPKLATVAGQDSLPTKENLYICKALVGGEIHAGTTGVSFNGCNIAIRNNEVAVPRFQVLTNQELQWKFVFDGNVPENAFSVNDGAKENARYVCRALYHDGLYPGETSLDASGCSITRKGEVRVISPYQILLN